MPTGGANPGAFQQTFEKIDKATGGVGGQVKNTLSDAGKDTLQQVAQTPIDILKSLIGADDSEVEAATSGSNPNDPQNLATGPNGQPSEFGKKLQEDRAKKEALLRQHRSVLAQYEQAFKEKKAEQEHKKEQQEQQQEQVKEQKKIEQKEKSRPNWLSALKQRIGGGKSEVGKGGN